MEVRARSYNKEGPVDLTHHCLGNLSLIFCWIPIILKQDKNNDILNNIEKMCCVLLNWQLLYL
jgi:hypothetical protein